MRRQQEELLFEAYHRLPRFFEIGCLLLLVETSRKVELDIVLGNLHCVVTIESTEM